MILDSLVQDTRVGIRLLWKDKAFSGLAVLVLACGIGAVTTQFTVVSAVALRGLSFPHPEQLVSVALIDPLASAERNFGSCDVPAAQDYEDLRHAQQSFAGLVAYISGATVNVKYGKTPQRYTGCDVTEDFFRIRRLADDGSRLHGRRQRAWCREGRHPFSRNLAARLSAARSAPRVGVCTWRDAPITFHNRRPAPYAPCSNPMLPLPRNGQMASGPCCSMVVRNRSAIVSSASSQEIGTNSPDPFPSSPAHRLNQSLGRACVSQVAVHFVAERASRIGMTGIAAQSSRFVPFHRDNPAARVGTVEWTCATDEPCRWRGR